MRDQKIGWRLSDADQHKNNSDQRKAQAENSQHKTERIVFSSFVVAPYCKKQLNTELIRI